MVDVNKCLFRTEKRTSPIESRRVSKQGKAWDALVAEPNRVRHKGSDEAIRLAGSEQARGQRME